MTGFAKVETAQRYLGHGWCVLPLRGRDKRPLIVWEPLQSASPSAEQVTDWFNRWPDANIGIVTGEISNLVVLDIDPKHGGDASLERLERRFGPLPATIEATTGGGGRHVYFAHPGGLIRNRTGLAQGIDSAAMAAISSPRRPFIRAAVLTDGWQVVLRRTLRSRRCRAGFWFRPVTSARGGRFLIGATSCTTACPRASAIRASHHWLDTYCGTKLTRKWCWNCSSPGTGCAAGRRLKTLKFLKLSQISSSFISTRAVAGARRPRPPMIATCGLKLRLVAGGPGFEPRLTESESAVLPLNYPPRAFRKSRSLRHARVGALAPRGAAASHLRQSQAHSKPHLPYGTGL